MNTRRLRPHGWLGVVLVALCWPLNWLLPGSRTLFLFFPLWLGYILLVDALVAWRRGDSLLVRAPGGFVLLFVASMPSWWLFELINRRVGNWIYLGAQELTGLEYFLVSSLNFSIVIPAVFETAELLGSLAFFDRFSGRVRCEIRITRRGLAWLFLVGLLMLGLLLTWPRYFYPLTWLALIALLEPVCAVLGRRGLLRFWRRGDWRPAAALAGGALVCGLFWELWNFYSEPKWVYRIPFLGFLHLFEMPALGYLGYLPFGLELYPMAHLILPRAPQLRLTPPGRTAAA